MDSCFCGDIINIMPHNNNKEDNQIHNKGNPMHKEISNVFYNPATGLVGGDKLYHKMRARGNITRRKIAEFLSRQEVAQRFKHVRPNYFPITGPPNSYQADLVFYPKQRGHNKGWNTAMTCIEITTRKGYVVPMNGKDVYEVIRAFKILHKRVGKMDNLTTDKGSEWISANFKKLVKQLGITHYTAEVADHHVMGMIERFNRTIKAIVAKYQAAYHTKTWANVIDDVVTNYNSNVHSTTGYPPNKVGVREAAEIRQKAAQRAYHVNKLRKIVVGDRVRTATSKQLFQKEGARWSKEVYDVSKDHGKSYSLTNPFNGKPLRRRYKHYELLRVLSDVETNPKVGVVKETPTPPLTQDQQKKELVKRLVGKVFEVDGNRYAVADVYFPFDGKPQVYYGRCYPGTNTPACFTSGGKVNKRMARSMPTEEVEGKIQATEARLRKPAQAAPRRSQRIHKARKVDDFPK